VRLSDPCCNLCTHSEETPCKDYIVCRASGPLCHEDEACRQKIKAANDGIINGCSDLVVKIGMSTCGLAAGSQAVYEALSNQLGEDDHAEIIQVGCMGHCYAEPLMEVSSRGRTSALYSNVKPADVSQIINKYREGNVEEAFAVRERKGTHKGEEGVPLFAELT